MMLGRYQQFYLLKMVKKLEEKLELLMKKNLKNYINLILNNMKKTKDKFT